MTLKTREDNPSPLRTRLRRLPLAFFVFALGTVDGAAHYQFPDIETVPTARLIANLERRLAAKVVESDRFGPGEVLESIGITALSCHWTRQQTGMPYSPHGLSFRDVGCRPTYDWMPTAVPRPQATAPK